MRRERRRELLPLSHEPHHLLLGPLALGGRLAHVLAVRVEGRVAQPLAELGQTGLKRVNLPLDLADAALLLLERYDEESIINVGCGQDVTISELCETIMDVTCYRGRLEFDASKPDGTPRKLLDVSRLAQLGWRPKISLREGVQQVYDWYRSQTSAPRRLTAAGD